MDTTGPAPPGSDAVAAVHTEHPSARSWVWALCIYRTHLDARSNAHALRASSAGRYLEVFERFCRFAMARGAIEPAEITPSACAGFIHARMPTGSTPAPSTSRLRLTVLRSAFEVLAEQGAMAGDPTAGLSVRHRAVPFVPASLTPAEARRLLLAGRTNPHDTLRPVTVALALCGATHQEVAAAVVDDLDSADGSLRVGVLPTQRLVPLTPRNLKALEARAHAQRRTWRLRGQLWKPDRVPLALSRMVTDYPMNSVAPTVSGNLAVALRHAGVRRPKVRPRSVRQYAANELYARTCRIEDVAERLGLTSLDAAARLIDWSWQDRWGDVIRAAETDPDAP